MTRPAIALAALFCAASAPPAGATEPPLCRDIPANPCVVTCSNCADLSRRDKARFAEAWRRARMAADDFLAGPGGEARGRAVLRALDLRLASDPLNAGITAAQCRQLETAEERMACYRWVAQVAEAETRREQIASEVEEAGDAE